MPMWLWDATRVALTLTYLACALTAIAGGIDWARRHTSR